jgi:hypothetical protein
MMRKSLLLALVLLVTGCATSVTKLDLPGIERSASVKVQDLRPETEKKSEIFSMLITSEAYATYRVSDAALDPSAIRLLQHRAYEKYADSGTPLSIKVHHLVVYRNLQSQLRKSAIGAGLGGVIGAMIAESTVQNLDGTSNALIDNPKSFDLLADTEYKRAFYTDSENPKHASVLIVYMDIEMQGKRTFTRTVAPIVPNAGDPLQSAVEAAIRYQLSQG